VVVQTQSKIGNPKSKFSSLAIGLFVMLLFWPNLADAQQTKKVPRIGYLSPRHGIEPREEAFRKGLRELGYIEGENIIIEWRFTEGKRERQVALAADLVRLKVDCIVTAGTAATQAAKQGTSTIPIVMTNVGDDPVRQEFVASLARPGGNITGFTIMGADLAGKRLELVKEAFPKASRIVILWDSTNPGLAAYVRETLVAARAMGVQLQNVELRSPKDKDIETAFRAAKNWRAEALIVLALAGSHRAQIVNLAAKNRLPAMYTDPSFVPAGGLMSYAADIPTHFRRAAIYVDKILKGAKPADLPVEQPIKFELAINLKTAKQIGVTIPPNLLARADKVIR
jgi:putative tryptophan/tyrosine transport system substrate-binding protein